MKCVCWSGARGLGGGGKTLPGSVYDPQRGWDRRENMTCSWGREELTNFLKFIH